VRIARLHRTVLLLEPFAAGFLAQFGSNRPEAPASAFLDLQGRVVAACEQVLLDPERALLVIPADVEGRLRDHLAKYLELAGAELKPTEFRVYFGLGGGAPPPGVRHAIPRKGGSVLLADRPLEPDVTEAEFTLFRLKNGIPLQGADYDREMLLNLGEDDRVSYDKGCYLGQEIIARVHFRGRPPKRLEVRSADTEAGARGWTSIARDPDTGKFLGFSFTENRGAEA
jgi:hypothetical protein